MQARCPNNPDHDRFVTVAHVSQDWVVDEHGNFIEEVDTLDVVAKPDAGNIWTCRTCDATAAVTD